MWDPQEATHEQTCDPAFDPGDMRNRAGSGSACRADEGRGEQRPYQEASKALAIWLQPSLVYRRAATGCEAARCVRGGLPGQRPQLRMQDMAASICG